MTRWLLDDGPLGLLATYVGASGFSRHDGLELWIAEQTAMDVRQSSRASFIQDSELIRIFAIEIGSFASDILYDHLGHPDGSSETKNLAERQAIAWALSEDHDAIFVTMDKRACIEALAELGRTRVAHVFDLFLTLFEEGYITREQLALLCERARKNQSLHTLPLRCQRALQSTEPS